MAEVREPIRSYQAALDTTLELYDRVLEDAARLQQEQAALQGIQSALGELQATVAVRLDEASLGLEANAVLRDRIEVHEQLLRAAVFGSRVVNEPWFRFWDLDDASDPTGRQRMVAKVMAAAPARVWSLTAIEKELDALEPDHDPAAFRLLLTRMVRRGYLERVARGRYRLAKHTIRERG